MCEAWIDIDSLEFLDVEDQQVHVDQHAPIPWEAGQVVWDVVFGKGAVKSVATQGVFNVCVDFGHSLRLYDSKGIAEGYPSSHPVRTLFFSEPTIIADTMPPNKPFVPVLKEGDEVHVNWMQGVLNGVYAVIEECETYITVTDGSNQVDLAKAVTTFRKLGEEIKWD